MKKNLISLLMIFVLVGGIVSFGFSFYYVFAGQPILSGLLLVPFIFSIAIANYLKNQYVKIDKDVK